MGKFLGPEELGPSIAELAKGSGVRFAVAFWGNEARRLFPKQTLPADARILCDLSMGGTNPRELEAMGAPNSDKIRYLNGLHAKVYLSDQGLITSSANASNNGIGFLDRAGLIEAGTAHPLESEAYKDASTWFENIWDRAKKVDAAALAEAQSAWSRRRRAMPLVQVNGPIDPRSLLSVVAAEPGRFRGVGFVFATGQSSVSTRDEAAKVLIAQDQDEPVSFLSREDRRALKEWPVADFFSEWSTEDINAWPRRFVCAYLNHKGRLSYYFYERRHVVVVDGDRGMVFAKRSPAIRKELGLEHGADVMASSDNDLAQRIIDNVGGDRLFESGETLAKSLAELG